MRMIALLTQKKPLLSTIESDTKTRYCGACSEKPKVEGQVITGQESLRDRH